MDKRLQNLITANDPEQLRQGVLDELRSCSPQQVESRCIDGIEEKLATLCVIFFQMKASTEHLVESIIGHDFLTWIVLYWQALRDHWASAANVRLEQRESLETIADLISTLERRRGEPKAAVKAQLIAAYFLSLALQNERYERPLLARVEYDVMLQDELYATLLKHTNLSQIVAEIRSRFQLK
jgi:hypothetical protein